MRTPCNIGSMLGGVIVLSAALGWAEAGAQVPLAGERGGAAPDSTSGVFRIGFGLGGAELGGESAGVSARGALTWSPGGSTTVTLRGTTAQELDILGPTPSEEVWDVGVLIGRQARGKRGYTSLAAGLALVGGMQRGERITTPPRPCYTLDFWCVLGEALTPEKYEKEPFETVGIPIELEAGFTFTPVLGLTADVWANLNRTRSAGGFTLGLVVGKLR